MLNADENGRPHRAQERVEARAIAAVALAAAAAASLVAQRVAERPRSIRFLDGDGVQWHVHERSAVHDPGAHGRTCLVFDCGEVIRRVWLYPEHWRALPADALLALSWQR